VPVRAANPAMMMTDWAELVEKVEAHAPLIGSTMRLAVRVIRMVPGLLVYELAPGIPGDPSAEIRRALDTATGERWQVERGTGQAQPSLEEARQASDAAATAAMHEDPLVRAVKAAFPEARIVEELGEQESGARPWSKRA
jgi:DNA polymerase III subunit gamma/tau